jgi:hypothetical protein
MRQAEEERFLFFPSTSWGAKATPLCYGTTWEKRIVTRTLGLNQVSIQALGKGESSNSYSS